MRKRYSWTSSWHFYSLKRGLDMNIMMQCYSFGHWRKSFTPFCRRNTDLSKDTMRYVDERKFERRCWNNLCKYSSMATFMWEFKHHITHILTEKVYFDFCYIILHHHNMHIFYVTIFTTFISMDTTTFLDRNNKFKPEIIKKTILIHTLVYN